MNIGVDVDDVLAELMQTYLDYHNEHYSTKVQKKDMFSYAFHEVFGGTEQESRDKVLDFYETDFFHNLKLVPGAKEGISQLAEKHQLCVITARPPTIQKQTKQWLNKHFQDSFHCINLTNQWYSTPDKQRTKSQVGKEQKIQIMIDDSLHHALDCAAQGIFVLLVDLGYPWNQSKNLPSNVKRVKSWEEIIKEVNNYQKNGTRP